MFRLLIIIIFCIISLRSEAQVFDTTKVAFNTKLLLLNLTCDLWEKEKVISYINATDPELVFLKSKGFSDVVFFKIKISDEGIQFKNEDKNDKKTFFFDPTLIDLDLGVFAYDMIAQKLYMLSCSKVDYLNKFFPVLWHRKNYFIKDKALKKKSKFKKSFDIEGFDIECLWNANRPASANRKK